MKTQTLDDLEMFYKFTNSDQFWFFSEELGIRFPLFCLYSWFYYNLVHYRKTS